MKITDIYTFIEEFRNGRNVWSRASIELAVREIERLRKENHKLKVRLEASENDLVLIEVNEMLKNKQARVQELEIYNKDFHLACINALDLHRESDVPKLKDIPKIIEELKARVQELEMFQDLVNRWSDQYYRDTDKLKQRIAELEQEQRWIPVRDYPSQVGWYRVITNNGTEQIREYVREPDRDIHYWDVKDGELIMMYTNPPLPQPPKEEE